MNKTLLCLALALAINTAGQAFYDPVAGRWLSRDILGEKGGVSLYGFVDNNGVNQQDLLGTRKTGFFDPSSDMLGVKREDLQRLQQAIDQAEKITDADGNRCYIITLLVEPVTSGHLEGLIRLMDRAIHVGHSDGQSIGVDDGTFNLQRSGDSGDFDPIGRYIDGSGRRPILNAFEQVVKRISELKPKDCCIPEEKISVTTGPHPSKQPDAQDDRPDTPDVMVDVFQ